MDQKHSSRKRRTRESSSLELKVSTASDAACRSAEFEARVAERAEDAVVLDDLDRKVQSLEAHIEGLLSKNSEDFVMRFIQTEGE